MSDKHLRCLPAVFTALALLAVLIPVSATPITDDTSTGPAKWAHEITVYIPLDPERNDLDNPRTRHSQIKDAVDKWKAHAGASVPAINSVVLDANGNIPTTGMPPDAGVEGTVVVQWVEGKTGEATPRIKGEPTGKKTADGTDILKNQTVVSVNIQIDKQVTANKAKDDQIALATMLHEFGHALQIDHSKKTDSVMQATLELYVAKAAPGDSDFGELGSIYTAFNGHLDGMATELAGGLWAYSYTATWLSGGDIPLFQIVVDGAPVQDVSVPDGWELSGFPFVATPNILAFRVAPTDTLDAYLNAQNPTITVRFTSPTAPGETLAWLGGDLTILGPLPVPEPPALLLMLMGCALLAMRFQRCSPRPWPS